MPIVPIPNTEELLKEETNFLVLAQLLKDESYKSFFVNRNRESTFLILDNGQYEGYNCSNEELKQACEEIKPNIVCCPDVFGNSHETYIKSLSFLEYMKEDKSDLEFMVIPHGNTKESFLECLNSIKEYSKNIKKIISIKEYSKDIKKFTWIGLSKIGALKAFKSRKECMQFLIDNGYPASEYNYHFLGCNEPKEILDAYQMKAKSMDSCLPVLYASEEKIIPMELSLKDRIPTPKDYFERNLDSEKINIAYYNIKQMRDLI